MFLQCQSVDPRLPFANRDVPGKVELLLNDAQLPLVEKEYETSRSQLEGQFDVLMAWVWDNEVIKKGMA